MARGRVGGHDVRRDVPWTGRRRPIASSVRTPSVPSGKKSTRDVDVPSETSKFPWGAVSQFARPFVSRLRWKWRGLAGPNVPRGVPPDRFPEPRPRDVRPPPPDETPRPRRHPPPDDRRRRHGLADLPRGVVELLSADVARQERAPIADEPILEEPRRRDVEVRGNPFVSLFGSIVGIGGQAMSLAREWSGVEQRLYSANRGFDSEGDAGLFEMPSPPRADVLQLPGMDVGPEDAAPAPDPLRVRRITGQITPITIGGVIERIEDYIQRHPRTSGAAVLRRIDLEELRSNEDPEPIRILGLLARLVAQVEVMRATDLDVEPDFDNLLSTMQVTAADHDVVALWGAGNALPAPTRPRALGRLNDDDPLVAGRDEPPTQIIEGQYDVIAHNPERGTFAVPGWLATTLRNVLGRLDPGFLVTVGSGMGMAAVVRLLISLIPYAARLRFIRLIGDAVDLPFSNKEPWVSN